MIKLAELLTEEIDEYDVVNEEDIRSFVEFMKGYKQVLAEADCPCLLEAEYRGRKVQLGKIMQGDVKKFKVYVKNDKGNVVKVNFGDPNLRVKNYNPKRAKSFRARHKCNTKKDRTTPGWWSCNIGRYSKLLGIKSSKKW